MLILICKYFLQVNNLEPKHGKCNDSVELEYFDLYSVASCYTNCKEIFLRDECRCRDVYMPKIDGNLAQLKQTKLLLQILII